jgi:hypothetical protein
MIYMGHDKKNGNKEKIRKDNYLKLDSLWKDLNRKTLPN